MLLSLSIRDLVLMWLMPRIKKESKVFVMWQLWASKKDLKFFCASDMFIV
jgi:hypothetical protein